MPSQKAHLIIFQYEASQSTGGVCSSIDIDPVGPDIGFSCRRVAMHDDLAKIFFVQKKIVANPEQITLRLFSQGNAGPYASMNEKEITATKRYREALQKAPVALGKRLEEGRGYLMPCLFVLVARGSDAVGKNSVDTSYGRPLRQQARIAQELQGKLLVVSHEQHKIVIAPAGNEHFDDLSRA